MIIVIANILITISTILLIWAIICTIDLTIHYDRETYPRWNWIERIGEELEKRGFYDD